MVERCGETLGLLHNEGISDIDTKKLRARLLYYFMNPCEKFQANRRLPWKLSVQLLKIVLFTVQVSLEKDLNLPILLILLMLFLACHVW